jgi:hypothetical protein
MPEEQFTYHLPFRHGLQARQKNRHVCQSWVAQFVPIRMRLSVKIAQFAIRGFLTDAA